MNYLRQLQYFVTLAEQENFARAAEVLHITQPALSRSIQALESSLNCQLFNRDARNISLTAHGKTALRHAEKILNSSRALKAAVDQLSNLDDGEIHFGASPIPAEQFAPIISNFYLKHPKVKQFFKVDDSKILSNRLLNDEIELFVTNTQNLINDPRFEIFALNNQSVVLFCRPSHPLANEKNISIADIYRFPLACTPIPTDTARTVSQLINGRNLLNIECDSLVVLKSLVRSSETIGISIHKAVAHELESGRLISLPLQDIDQHFCRYGIVCRAGYKLSPAAEVMKRLIIEHDANTSKGLTKTISNDLLLV